MKTWTSIDKTTWGPGPWQTEPDKAWWIDPATTVECMIRRGGGGALCGYVAVPTSHPWYGRNFEDITAQVHGGITFASETEDTDEATGLCSVPQPGYSVIVWWVGFDCGHGWDVHPEWATLYLDFGMEAHWQTYRDFEYVKAEVENLATHALVAVWGQ